MKSSSDIAASGILDDNLIFTFTFLNKDDTLMFVRRQVAGNKSQICYITKAYVILLNFCD